MFELYLIQFGKCEPSRTTTMILLCRTKSIAHTKVFKLLNKLETYSIDRSLVGRDRRGVNMLGKCEASLHIFRLSYIYFEREKNIPVGSTQNS